MTLPQDMLTTITTPGGPEVLVKTQPVACARR